MSIDSVRAKRGAPQGEQGGRLSMRQIARSTRGAEETFADFLTKYGLIGAWAVVVIVFSLIKPTTFATIANFQTIFGSQSILLVLALGLIVPFTAGEFDLSIAGVFSVALVVVGQLNVRDGLPVGVAVAVALAFGLAVGLTNALLVVGLGVDSIVVTLGMGTLLSGIAYGINLETTGGISNGLVEAVRYQFLGLPLAFYYGLALTTVVWYVLRFTPLGQYLYLVGSSREVARLVGVSVDRLRVGAFVTCGLVSAGAGVLESGWLGASDPNVASSYLLPTFAAVFLGATAIVPGRFNAWGTFIAVYFLVTGITGLELMGLIGWVEQVFYGGSLVAAVTFAHLAGRSASSFVRLTGRTSR